MREELKTMQVGEERHYPKEMYNKINGAKTALYCRGYSFIVRSKKEWDYIVVIRLE